MSASEIVLIITTSATAVVGIINAYFQAKNHKDTGDKLDAIKDQTK